MTELVQTPRLSGVRGFHFETTLMGSTQQVLARVEAAVGAATFAALEWHATEIDGGSLVIAMPVDPPTEPLVGRLHARLSIATVEIRSGPLYDITNGPVDEPPSAEEIEYLGPEICHPDDWYWPLSERPPVASYPDAPKIRIGHLDTGISALPALQGGYDEAGSLNTVDYPHDPIGKGVICWDRPWWFNLVDHGTSTAALIIGHPVEDQLIVGMVPRSVGILVPARVLPSGPVIGPPDISRVAHAIDWAVNEGKCKVLSISLGLPLPSHELESAMESAFESGVIVCCSAAQIDPWMSWPAAAATHGWGVACGGSTVERRPVHDTNWHNFPRGYVTISAPATRMPKSSWANRDCSSGQPATWCSGGNSYAAPFVASIAALWLARHATAIDALQPSEIVTRFRRILADTAIEWADPEYRGDLRYGPGIIDPNAVIATEP